MRIKHFLFAAAAFFVSMTAFAKVYDIDISFQPVTGANGEKLLTISTASILNTMDEEYYDPQYQTTLNRPVVHPFTVREVDSNGKTVNNWDFKRNASITIEPGDGRLVFNATYDSFLSVDVDLNRSSDLDEVYHTRNWYSVSVTHMNYMDPKYGGTAKILVGGSPSGTPLPAPVTTLLIALGLGAALVIIRSRKQAKA